jgi:hypothetical protein
MRAYHLALLAGPLWAAVLFAAPTAALAASRFAFVATTGSDRNACTETAPCATLAQAVSVTASGGTVVVLDSGDFGAVDINDPFTITSQSGRPEVATTISVNVASTA